MNTELKYVVSRSWIEGEVVSVRFEIGYRNRVGEWYRDIADEGKGHEGWAADRTPVQSYARLTWYRSHVHADSHTCARDKRGADDIVCEACILQTVCQPLCGSCRKVGPLTRRILVIETSHD